MKLRLGAIFYDGLLLFSVLFFAVAPVLVMTGGQAVESSDWIFRLYIAGVAFLYFGWQWRHGYTLGMKAWRLMIVDADGGRISWAQALLRFTVAILSWLALGAGFLWALADRQGLTWHDRASGTRLVVRQLQPAE